MPESYQSHREALFHSCEEHPADAPNGRAGGDRVRQEPPRIEPRLESETIGSGNRLERRRSPGTRRLRSIRRCYCKPSPGRCNCVVEGCCRKLAFEFCILPIAVIAFQHVLEMHLLRDDKAQSRIVNLKITRKGWKTE